MKLDRYFHTLFTDEGSVRPSRGWSNSCTSRKPNKQVHSGPIFLELSWILQKVDSGMGSRRYCDGGWGCACQYLSFYTQGYSLVGPRAPFLSDLPATSCKREPKLEPWPCAKLLQTGDYVWPTRNFKCIVCQHWERGLLKLHVKKTWCSQMATHIFSVQ